MSSKTFRIKVGKEQVRKLVDPYGRRRDAYFALVKVRDLPMDLPLDVNPRNQDTGSRVSKQIQETLLELPENFHLMNRGMTVIAKGVECNNGLLALQIPQNSKDYGVLDGGHTYQVIRKNVLASLEDKDNKKDPQFFDAHVRMEIMEGLPDDVIVDIARARNTSAQVKGYSLANLEGKFGWLQEELDKEPFGRLVAYRENENDNEKPIDVMEVVALATMFHPDFEDPDNDNPPVMAYSSKARCLEMFGDDVKQPGYVSMRPILRDVLKLYDYIHAAFPSLYEELGGFSGLAGKVGKGVRMGNVVEVKQYKEGFQLYYLNQRAEYRIPDGWLYPMVAAFRGLVDYKPKQTAWATNPFEFFDRHGKKLVQMTLEAGLSLGRKPNNIGKNKAHWRQLHDRVALIQAKSK